MSPSRRVLLAVLSGALLTAAHPLVFGELEVLGQGPNGLLAFVALIPWLRALRAAAWTQALGLTVVTAFTMFVGTMHWLFVALHTYGGVAAPTAVFGLFLVCLVCALFMAPAGIAIALTEGSIPLWVSAPLAWVGVELLRTTLFPWSNLAYTQWALPTAQTADLFGLHAVSFVVVLVNAALVTARARPKMIAGAVLLAAVGYGLVRKNQVAHDEQPNTVMVGLAQGNVAQNVKHDRAYRDEILSTYNRLTAHAIERGAELVIWPEGALPGPTPHKRTQTLSAKRLTEAYDARLLIGSASYWHDYASERELPLLHNSAFLVSGSDRRVVGRADKTRLVPFGEYVPFPLPGFKDKLVVGDGDYVPGDIRVIDGLGVLICYEAIFPGISRRLVAADATILVSISNDAWHGRSSAPTQHLIMTAFRAIETRRPIVRAANTGISAVIEPTGQIRNATELFETTVTVTEVGYGRNRTSLYQRLGDTFGWIGLLSLLVLPLIALTKKNG